MPTNLQNKKSENGGVILLFMRTIAMEGLWHTSGNRNESLLSSSQTHLRSLQRPSSIGDETVERIYSYVIGHNLTRSNSRKHSPPLRTLRSHHSHSFSQKAGLPNHRPDVPSCLDFPRGSIDISRVIQSRYATSAYAALAADAHDHMWRFPDRVTGSVVTSDGTRREGWG